MKAIAAFIAMLTVAAPAGAATVGGHAALAIAGIVGANSPVLTTIAKAALARLFDGQAVAPSKQGKLGVQADAVVCRAGNVDIAAFRCDLTVGAKTVVLTGRRAHELFATVAEAGVPPDGAAGTVFEALHALSCTVDPAVIAQKAGGGAECAFEPGPS